MSVNWDIYRARINKEGFTHKERQVNRLKNDISKHILHNPSCKTVLLNGVETNLIINTGTKTYYKEFRALPDETIVCGDYIQWKNRTWLVYEADIDDDVYIDGKMYECNYVMLWQNNNGDLVERPSFVVNASAYNNGESGNNTITLATNQFMVYMPIDEETINIRNGKRFFIDNYNEDPYVYSLTRPDNVSIKFGDKGITYYIFTQTEVDKNKDKQVTLEDGRKVWIADYISPTLPVEQEETNETAVLSAVISGNQNLKLRLNRTYSVTFNDKNGDIITDIDFVWNINAAFKDKISSSINGNSIKLSVTDDSLLGESFLLEVLTNDNVVGKMQISITNFL